jgi:hypothetical protein
MKGKCGPLQTEFVWLAAVQSKLATLARPSRKAFEQVRDANGHTGELDKAGASQITE